MANEPETEPYRGYELHAVYQPPEWQVNIYRTVPYLRLPQIEWPPIKAATRDAALAEARQRVDVLISG